MPESGTFALVGRRAIKPVFEALAYPGIASFKCGRTEITRFEYPFHVHPEFEFTCLLNGTGRQVIGDHVSAYSDGELVFLGPNLPHAWLIDEHAGSTPTTVLNIQFKEDFLGADFFARPELLAVSHLLARARAGLGVYGATRARIQALMERIIGEDPFERVLTILTILNDLSRSNEARTLSSLGYVPANPSRLDMERMARVFEYVLQHYAEDLDLARVAEMSGLSRSAFCRCFKRRTGRTLFQFVNELRVKHACMLLQEGRLSIAATAYESGYGNLSHFNRSFRRMMKTTPGDYRAAMSESSRPRAD